MGTLQDTARLASFSNDIYPNGVDLDRSKYHQDGGFYKVQDGVTIRRGMMVSRAPATGEIIPVDSATDAYNVFGIAKAGNETLGTSALIDVPHVVAHGQAVSAIGHGNISNVIVTTVPNSVAAGDVIPATNNYTLGAVAGTLTWDNPTTGTNAPANGATVYVRAAFALTQTDMKFEGVKFHSNTNDDMLYSSEGRITVFTDWSIIFTTEWDQSRTYDTQGVLSNLYCDDNGRFSNNAGLSNAAARFVGRVFQLPTAGDPYMGVQFSGQPVAAV